MSKNRHGTVYPYFICVGRQMKRSDCRQKAVLIEMVEYLVEQHYADVQLSAADAGQIKQALLDQLASQRSAADQERGFQQQRLHKLAAERKKLLEAFYSDSIPAELLKAEQARITSEMEQAKRRLSALSAEFDVIEANLAVAVEFAKHCQQAYLAGTPKERRQINQVVFEKLYVHDDQEVTSSMTEPFRSLLGVTVHDPKESGELASGMTNPEPMDGRGFESGLLGGPQRAALKPFRHSSRPLP